jgi:hypothetical protein
MTMAKIKSAGAKRVKKAAPKKAKKAAPKKAKKGSKAKPRARAKKRPEPPSEPPPSGDDMPRFAVAFIDSAGQEHVATALAPDPGVALSGLLEKAAEFEEPWLGDLVAVVVSHPDTWASVRERVLDVFER